MSQLPNNPAALENSSLRAPIQRNAAPPVPRSQVAGTVQAPGLVTTPPVSQGAQLMDQLNRALGVAGQTARQVGRHVDREAARAEQFDRGQAVLNVRETLPGLQQQIANGEITTPEGVSVADYANELIDEQIPPELSEAWGDEYRRRMIGPTVQALTAQNQEAISENRQLLMQRVQDAATGVKDTDSLAAKAHALENELGLSPIEAKHTVGLHAMEYAAENGLSEAFEAAGVYLGDNFAAEQARHRETFQRTRDQQQQRELAQRKEAISRISEEEPPVEVFRDRVDRLGVDPDEADRTTQAYTRQRIEAAAGLGDVQAVQALGRHLAETDQNRGFIQEATRAASTRRSRNVANDMLERIQFGELSNEPFVAEDGRRTSELQQELEATRHQLTPQDRQMLVNAAPQAAQRSRHRSEVNAVQGGAAVVLTPDHDSAFDEMARESVLPVRDEGGNVTTDEDGNPVTQPAIGPGAQINEPVALGGMIAQHVDAGGSMPSKTADAIYSSLASGQPATVMAGIKTVATLHTAATGGNPGARNALADLIEGAAPETRAAIGAARGFADRANLDDPAQHAEMISSVASAIEATKEAPSVSRQDAAQLAGDDDPDEWIGEVMESVRPERLDPGVFVFLTDRPFGLPRRPEIETLPIVEQQALQTAAEHFRVASRFRAPSIAREEAAERAREFIDRNTDIVTWPGPNGRDRHVRVPVGGPDRQRLPDHMRWGDQTKDLARFELQKMASAGGLEHTIQEPQPDSTTPRERKVIARIGDFERMREVQPEADPLGRGWRFRYLSVDPMGEGEVEHVQVQTYDAETGEHLGTEPLIWQPPDGIIERQTQLRRAENDNPFRPRRWGNVTTLHFVPREELDRREREAQEEAAARADLNKFLHAAGDAVEQERRRSRFQQLRESGHRGPVTPADLEDAR